MRIQNFFNKSPFGLVIDWKFHKKNKWVSIFAPHLVDQYVATYNPLIITSQADYNLHKNKLRYIVAMEPGWAAPKLRYDTSRQHLLCVMASDPHNKTKWFMDYVLSNNINYVLSQYLNPFLYHFPDFPLDRLIHFPWAVPDQFIHKGRITSNGNDVAIFGGQHGKAYDVRNWCRKQEGVTNYSNSGVEHKAFSDQHFFNWLSEFDAVIAAGSSFPEFDLVTPKYFEIPAAGALLIGQQCSDLDGLGFNEENALLFEKNSFLDKIAAYKKNPDKFIPNRARGNSLIREKHMISHRMALLDKLFTGKDIENHPLRRR